MQSVGSNSQTLNIIHLPIDTIEAVKGTKRMIQNNLDWFTRNKKVVRISNTPLTCQNSWLRNMQVMV